ncbi:MAG: hypothetical protein LBT17_00790 [Mycoplasmataceae bacterium]|jgi:hypothetical protein|nr:hypothetical protein [Mycoplasmataceae bacterium]
MKLLNKKIEIDGEKLCRLVLQEFGGYDPVSIDTIEAQCGFMDYVAVKSIVMTQQEREEPNSGFEWYVECYNGAEVKSKKGAKVLFDDEWNCKAKDVFSFIKDFKKKNRPVEFVKLNPPAVAKPETINEHIMLDKNELCFLEKLLKRSQPVEIFQTSEKQNQKTSITKILYDDRYGGESHLLVEGNVNGYKARPLDILSTPLLAQEFIAEASFDLLLKLDLAPNGFEEICEANEKAELLHNVHHNIYMTNIKDEFYKKPNINNDNPYCGVVVHFDEEKARKSFVAFFKQDQKQTIGQK